MGKLLKKNLIKQLKDQVKKDKSLVKYMKELPEEEKLTEDLGKMDNLDLFNGVLDIKDIEIVKIEKNNKPIIRVLSIVKKEDEMIEFQPILDIEDNKLKLDDKIRKSLIILDNKELENVEKRDDIVIEKVNDKNAKLNNKENISKEEKEEKEKISKTINQDEEDILNVVNIQNVEAGSKLFDTKRMNNDSKIKLVRLKNYKFKLLEEKPDGNIAEIRGYEVTPVAKELFNTIANKFDYTSTLRYNDIKSGKTKEGLTRYDLFQIRGLGDTGEANSLLYIGVGDKSTVDMMENVDGGYEFKRVEDVENKYPRNVIMEGKQKDINLEEDDKRFNSDLKEDRQDLSIEEEIQLKEELLKIEYEIENIYEDPDYDSDEPNEELKEKQNRRDEIMYDLGISEEKSTEEFDERDVHMYEHKRDTNN